MRLAKRKRTVQAAVAVDDRMNALMSEYLAVLEARNFSGESIRTYGFSIGVLLEWCRERGIVSETEITRPVLERYQRFVFHYRKQNGAPLTVRSQITRLRPIKGWFRWLARQHYILHNPASELDLPRMENRLPRHVLNAEEVEKVLALPNTKTSSGLRDRAILETLYATGMRRFELAGLKTWDIDYERCTAMIRLGKGKKDRHVPLGERAIAWLRLYIEDVRPGLLTSSDDGTVFIAPDGEAFERWQISGLVRRYVLRAELGKTGSCHLFRHSVATLMLENGADVRVIQELLGHANLDTTQVYTRVSINLLKQVHAATHPAAHLAPRVIDAAKVRSAEAEAELMSSLEKEADEDEQ